MTILLSAISIFAAVSYATMVEKRFAILVHVCFFATLSGLRNPKFLLFSYLASYARFCIDIVSRPPGFITMSRRGGLRSSARDKMSCMLSVSYLRFGL